MPTINLIRDHLFEAIGKKFTDEEFDELCFEFGVEVDKVYTEEVTDFTADGSRQEMVFYAIDIPANRYDILCMEGIARALRIFLNLQAPPVYHRIDPVEGRQKMIVESSTAQIRPYAVCAVLRGVKFDKKRYNSFIELQDKLHQNVCRKRSYVAIGTHDMDTIKGPFRYKALPPKDIRFEPLVGPADVDSNELLDWYREDAAGKHLKPYTDLIYDSPVYPVIFDNSENGGKVLSLPPIINGMHSKIQLSTENVFIECTGTDLTKCNIVLDTVVTMFSEYSSQPFHIDAVDIEYEDSDGLNGKLDQVTPKLSERKVSTPVGDILGTIGIKITPQEITRLCEKMQLGPAEYDAGTDSVIVNVPPTRSDILHPVDVIEDVAIAYGYNNIELKIPQTLTVGRPLPINQLCDLLRNEVGRAGYQEMLTHGLCSKADNYTKLGRAVSSDAVELSNPADLSHEVVRSTLMPGALKALAFNKELSVKGGLKLFEFSDVVVSSYLNKDNEIGCRNERHFVALHADNTASSFEVIHGLVDRIMTLCQIVPEQAYGQSSLTPQEYNSARLIGRPGLEYSLVPSQDPVFFPGMGAEVVLTHFKEQYTEEDERGEDRKVLKTVKVGVLGVVHPQVLSNFGIINPATIVEMNIEAIE